MRVDRFAVASLLAVAVFISLPEPASAQSQVNTPPRGARGKAFVVPGDPAILTPEMLTPDVDSRLFVESFLISLFTMESGVVYDAYLHSDMKDSLTREAFHQQVFALKDVVGPLTRVVLTYLRQENQQYDGADGGWTEHVLVFQRDPNVHARVEFKRVADGHWKVIHSGIRSPRLDRLQQAREAARQAAEDTAPPPAAGVDQASGPPVSRP